MAQENDLDIFGSFSFLEVVPNGTTQGYLHPWYIPNFTLSVPPKYDLLEKNNDLVYCIIYYMFMTFL
jgi:hypothetical protein